MHPPYRSGPRAVRRVQRGAATLVVVMVLFFIVALVAAYTSRNLIFEQRTSANQYRSTQAFEAAEAGLEWALTMLNSGRIDAVCQPHTDPATTDGSFRQRYLDIAAGTGAVVERTRSDGQPLRPACVFDGAGWQCSCPVDDAPSLTEPAGAGPFPAFVLRFSRNDPAYPTGFPGPYPTGIIRIESTGCTRVDVNAGCAAAAASGDGRATVTILAALKSSLVTPPKAAVTVRGDLTRAGGSTMNAVNTSDAVGTTVHSGRSIPDEAWLVPHSAPGSPGDSSFIEDDAVLDGLKPQRMFAAVFGMAPDTYRLQPGTVTIRCAVDCSAATVRDIARLNPGRMLWIEAEAGGAFDISIADPIGSTDFPVTMVVAGDLTVSNANAKLNGVIYTTGDTLANFGGLTLSGALIAEVDLRLTNGGISTVAYDAAMLGLLNRTSGSFVRVPGSWRDF